jgi:hypothetical protein
MVNPTAPHVGSTETDVATRLALIHRRDSEAMGALALMLSKPPGQRRLNRGVILGWAATLEWCAAELRLIGEDKR